MRRIWLAVLTAAALYAQADPPARVGRLNYLAGSVSMQPGGVEDWVPAELNRPLTTGDNLWVDQGSRAELHIGSTGLRLNNGTSISFLNLDDQTVQIRLTEGSLQVRLRHLEDQDSFEIDTPNLAFTLLRPGEYRVDVDPGGNATMVRVRGGDGEVSGGGEAFAVHARQQAWVQGGNSPTYDVTAIDPRDEFENWCIDRDQREDRSQSMRYVSRETTGYEELDANGDWTSADDYGAVWIPRGVPVDWAPYHYGHWAWVEPWGWTWIDDSPWGFAPFHYGRWVYWRSTWAWVPGPMVVRPVYAPALVAWVGGPNWSVGVGVGGGRPVGWFPLGPREPYVPAYRVSERYSSRVNVDVNVTVRYVNRGAPRAFTVVTEETMVRSRPVREGVVRGGDFRSGEVIAVAPIAPRRESVVGVRVDVHVSRPPDRVVVREVVARRTPPAPPVPFAERERALRADPGRPLPPEQVERYRRPDAPSRTFVRQAPVTPSRDGNRGVAPADNYNRPEIRPSRGPESRPDRIERDQPRDTRMPEIRPARPERRTEAEPEQQQPRRMETPRPADPPRRVEQPRPVDRPAEQPRRVEQPRPVDRPAEQPRRVEQPKPVERPRPAERREERKDPPPRERRDPPER